MDRARVRRRGVRVIAIIAAYNEEAYIDACLRHLHEQGVQAYLIDDSSTDRTVSIAERHLGRGLVAIEPRERRGVHSLREKLLRKEELAAHLDADWFLHMDADEFRAADRSDRTLSEAIEEIDREGFNAVGFSEFVFIPTRESPDHEHADFQQTMRSYYHFCPFPQHRLNLWKRQDRVDLATRGGHQVQFPERRVAPVEFRMRHYHFLSVPHAVRKLVGRPYPPEELERGWHGWRVKLRPEMRRGSSGRASCGDPVATMKSLEPVAILEAATPASISGRTTSRRSCACSRRRSWCSPAAWNDRRGTA